MGSFDRHTKHPVLAHPKLDTTRVLRRRSTAIPVWPGFPCTYGYVSSNWLQHVQGIFPHRCNWTKKKERTLEFVRGKTPFVFKSRLAWFDSSLWKKRAKPLSRRVLYILHSPSGKFLARPRIVLFLFREREREELSWLQSERGIGFFFLLHLFIYIFSSIFLIVRILFQMMVIIL